MGLHILVVYIIKRVKSREKGAYRMQRADGARMYIAPGRSRLEGGGTEQAWDAALRDARAMAHVAQSSGQMHSGSDRNEALVAQLKDELGREQSENRRLAGEVERFRGEHSQACQDSAKWSAQYYELEQVLSNVHSRHQEEIRRLNSIIAAKAHIDPEAHAELQRLKDGIARENQVLKAALDAHKPSSPANSHLHGHGPSAHVARQDLLVKLRQDHAQVSDVLSHKNEEAGRLHAENVGLRQRLQHLEGQLAQSHKTQIEEKVIPMPSTPSAHFLEATERKRLEEFRQSISDCQSGPDTYRVPLDVMRILVHVLQNLGIPH
jgi:hypothetical protein